MFKSCTSSFLKTKLSSSLSPKFLWDIYAIIQQREMGLYTKIDKQIDNFYEIVTIKKSISMKKFYSKTKL